MSQILSTLKNPNKLHNITKVRSLFSINHTFTTTTTTILTDPPPASPSPNDQINGNHIDLPSVNFSSIAKSVLSRFSHLLETKKDKSYASCKLKDLLLDVSDVIPEITRKFWRVLVLRPEDVLEILLGFQFESGNFGFRGGKIGTLWGIFKWASEQYKGFRHLPRSQQVMASMLVQVGMFREVELLLLAMESEGVLSNGNEIISNLIEGYIGVGNLRRAVLVFDQMREQGLVPSLSCYRVLIDHLVKMKRTQLAFRVLLDLFGMRINLSDVDKARVENVVSLLCRERKIKQSRNLVKKFKAYGLELSGSVVNEIACGYCEKKDFEDLLSFFVEMKHAPDVLTGNRIVYTLCSIFGVERADLFRKELEHLGFRPDEITFGILIGRSVREGNLRSSFIYLSEILSTGLNPDLRSYNALIAGVFKAGMWRHAKDILDEMEIRGTPPNLSTYRLLLAGYCKARQFDEAKMMVSEMEKLGFIELSTLEDPLCKAFTLLGLNPLAVRLRRDNDIGFSKTEFYDNLGNGLYLDTDLDEYEKNLTSILEDSMIPDFNSLITLECAHGNSKVALLLVDEMVRWGQELSLSVFSTMVKELCASRSLIKMCPGLSKKMPKLANHLDQESLNLLIQACCKKGLVHDGKIIFYGMLQKGLTIKNETCTALLMGLCKKGISKDLHCCWDIARNKKWLPGLEDSKALVECLCHKKMLKETLELFESLLVFGPYLSSDICHIFLQKLSETGFSTTAYALLEDFIHRGYDLDQMAYSHVIRGLCKEKKFQVAFKILDSMLATKMAPGWDVSVSLIPQLLRANKFEKAIALKEISLKEQSVLPYSLYTALIKGFCMSGKVEEASKQFQDMLCEGLYPEAEVYNMLIEGHCQGNNFRKVRELLGVMIRKQLNLSISSYRSCVHWMCIAGRVPWALSLKELMLGQNESHNLIIYNILIFYLLTSRNSFLVNKVLDELLEKGLEPDEVTYNFLIYGFLKRKDVSSSVRYLSTMISKGLRPRNRSLRTVISCLCDVGELGKALELSREMQLKGWFHDSIVQNAMVEGLLSRGKLQEAEHFLDRMVDRGLVPDTIIYDNLIKRFCGSGRMNKAVDLFNLMLKKGNIPNSASYDSVIHSLCTFNKLDQALDFHSEMLARNLKPKISTWDVLICQFCQEGRIVEAERLLTCMVRLGETPTREMYSVVINKHFSENNLKKASDVMQVMQQSGYNPDFNTHWSLISNLSSSSDKDNKNSSQGFLSRLLSGSAFSWRKDSNAKRG
ncbi:hypothetical protein LWI28_028439 [Acer negundo]|uniref:Pentatricopeptide repeat-containing protein n=1 Tax=Acer negundo TaxID=4023 RepID=A0AAD5I7X0_ACENE|nr:hypothetical protein LWI28_028439 [Acer negundo]